MNFLSKSLLITALLGFVPGASLSAFQAPEIPEDVKATIRVAVDGGHVPGIVVGIINPRGTAYFSYGSPRPPLSGTLDENSVFYTGSISKVFISVILADMVERGEVGLDDPLQTYLPEGVRAPTRNGRSITLAHLASHSSGLPHNAPGRDSIETVYRALSSHTLRRDIGSEYEYSNWGFDLLANSLALHAGRTYEELLFERLTDELGMSDTRIALTPDMENRLAAESYGSDFEEKTGPGMQWKHIKSTAHDLLTFLAANMGLTETSLGSAMQMTHVSRVSDPTRDGHSIGLG